MLYSLADYQRLCALSQRKKFGRTILEEACDRPEVLKTVLEALPVKDRLKAVTLRSYYGRTVIHLLTFSHIDVLTMILKLLPEADRLEAVRQRCFDRMSALDYVNYDGEKIKRILNLLPENKHLEIFAGSSTPDAQDALLNLNIDSQFRLLKLHYMENKLRTCLSTLDDNKLTQQPCLLLFKRLLQEEPQSSPSPLFFEQGPRTSRLDKALKGCQSHQEFLLKINKFGLPEIVHVPMDLAEGQKHKHTDDDLDMRGGKRQCIC